MWVQDLDGSALKDRSVDSARENYIACCFPRALQVHVCGTEYSHYTQNYAIVTMVSFLLVVNSYVPCSVSAPVDHVEDEEEGEGGGEAGEVDLAEEDAHRRLRDPNHVVLHRPQADAPKLKRFK